jgi:chemotaxis signal transduction protein
MPAMNSETALDNPTAGHDRGTRSLALRFELTSGACSVPLDRVHHLAGYATLAGEPEDYFLGWLRMRGELVPVFDLNRVICDQPTPAHFGSRIMVLNTPAGSPATYLGLLALRITDTMETDSEAVEQFDPESYLPMLYPLIPSPPEEPEEQWPRT